MAITLSAAGTAIAANAANYANMGLGSEAEATAVGNFLSAAGLKPGLALEILRLINNTNLTEDR